LKETINEKKLYLSLCFATTLLRTVSIN
jgi:hypothetical protein